MKTLRKNSPKCSRISRQFLLGKEQMKTTLQYNCNLNVISLDIDLKNKVHHYCVFLAKQTFQENSSFNRKFCSLRGTLLHEFQLDSFYQEKRRFYFSGPLI